MTQRRLAHVLVAATVSLGGVAALAPSATAAPQVTGTATTRAADPVAAQAEQAFAALGEVLATGSPSRAGAYLAQLDAIADVIAARLTIDPASLRAAWRAADVDHQRALLAALGQLGVPYRTNMSKEGVGFDCSGLTAYAWGRAGIAVAHQSRSQINAAEDRTLDTAHAGDLVFYPGHVMMYLGVDHAIVHAPQRGDVVEVGLLNQHRGRTLRFGDPTP